VDLTSGLFQALAAMQSWGFLLAFMLGCLNGMVFGILPGLSGSVGIALMIPFTYGMGATEAMALFVAALSGQTFAGSISAILLNTPGTSPNAATTFDGYPLARAGRGGFAIGISATASFFGSLIGVVVLIALLPVMRSIVLAFSFPELTMLGLMGLTAIAVASRGSMLKGLLSGLLGLLVSFVGFAPIGGDVRFVLGRVELYGGLGIVPVLIGLFAVTEAIRLLVRRERVARDISALRFGRRQVLEGVAYTVKQPFLLVRSALVGTGIGIVPGVGGTLASFLAYFQAAKTVKHPTFGRGDPRGVLAPEAANDAKDAGAALPTLAFGIPGSADWAIILGAMIIHGITPGPNLIRENPDVVWVAILVIVAASFFSSVVGVGLGPSLVQVTKLRPSTLAPIVIALAVTGAFGLGTRATDVLVAVAFGLLGYWMRSVGMPVIPLILGLVLGKLVERSYLQSLETFGGLAVFVTRPLSLTLLLMTVAILLYEGIATYRTAKRSHDALEEGLASATRPVSVGLVSFLAVLAVFALVQAAGFTPEGGLFPRLVGWAILLVAGVYLAIAWVPALRSRLGAVIADGGGMEQAPPTGTDDARPDGDVATPAPAGPIAPSPGATATGVTADQQAATRTSAPEPRALPERWALPTTLLLITALGLAVALFGLAVAMPVALVLLFRFLGLESWRLTAVLTVGTLTFLYLMFVVVLQTPLEGGLLLDY
jgi:TctA family transporter